MEDCIKKKKKPRKISCLPCRSKKARCDSELPFCSRCIRNNRQHLCIYPKPKTYGRPPKKASLHKQQETSLTTSKQHEYKEFIFENTQLQQQQESKVTVQILSEIEQIFSHYRLRSFILRQSLGERLVFNSQFITLASLHPHFTWLTTNFINLTIKRSCRLLNIDTFLDPELALTAFMKHDDDDRDATRPFFSNSSHNTKQSSSSPLDLIPTDQAIQLIHYFFQLFPYHIVLNKTKLLEDYSNHSAEPLLLSVVYGIALHCYYCQNQHTNTGQYRFHSSSNDGNSSNPFLAHAYRLMEHFFDTLHRSKSVLSAPSLASNYQAIVILGVFESLFGMAKRGMTIISLSYIVAVELGIFQSHVDLLTCLDPIDRELVITTYWTALSSTAYGCIDSKLFACLPKTEYNLVGGRTQPTPPLTPQEERRLQEHETLLRLIQTDDEQHGHGGAGASGKIDARVQLALNQFASFIIDHKHEWSFQQLFTIETTYYLYCIHFSSLKERNVVGPIRFLNVVEERISEDQLERLQPLVWQLIQLLQMFLKEIEDRRIFLADGSSSSATQLLPIGLVSTSLETIVKVTVFQGGVGMEIMKQVRAVRTLLSHPFMAIKPLVDSTRLLVGKLNGLLSSSHRTTVTQATTAVTQATATKEFTATMPYLGSSTTSMHHRGVSGVDFNNMPLGFLNEHFNEWNHNDHHLHQPHHYQYQN
ncbi:MAG: hypothetical protein EXX96DRAFT_529388 [Benjaminiella poitrasii]|nr:MAG: hypothetical protein EXX96DRAFT_529388 [Benjaminiella poitrasii]